MTNRRECFIVETNICDAITIKFNFRREFAESSLTPVADPKLDIPLRISVVSNLAWGLVSSA